MASTVSLSPDSPDPNPIPPNPLKEAVMADPEYELTDDGEDYAVGDIEDVEG